MPTKKVDYAALNAELEDILAELQGGELAVDTAMTKYQRGLTVVKLLETHLEQAENTITKLKAEL